ncbi:MAG: histidine kinase [Prevotella sp.]|nr:histidine kinase [Prevotella sp.]
MRSYSVGQRLFASVLTIFLVFAVSFIIFQWNREKQYKIELLESKLQDYNDRMDEAIHHMDTLEEATVADYVRRHGMKDMRVTLIDRQGKVVFDNIRKDYAALSNHANRPEVMQAIKTGNGSAVDRNSKTLKRDFFYSATFFPADGLVIRSALPYNADLANILQADQHFVWFALVAILGLTLVLYRFANRLGTNITKLKIFASRAEHNESLETEDLAAFPDDELGEIAEKIIKIYKRLQTTRREQDVLKRQLTQNIAHELKTPVASIQGYLETIIDNPNIDNTTKQQFLERCYAQSGRLTSLLQDISTLNRMDDAPDMQEFEEVDIAELVHNIQRETSLQLQERKMTFENLLPSQLKIKGSRSLLYSIFRNLTDNAIAYAGVGTTITLMGEKRPGRWSFMFKDNGGGVPVEHLPRLFERFYRVDKGRSRKMGGTGLGLAIVKNAVLLHHGAIRVKNDPKGGLVFTFYLSTELSHAANTNKSGWANE